MNLQFALNIIICSAITVSSFTLAWLLKKNKITKVNKPSIWSLISLWSLIGINYLTTIIVMATNYLNNQNLNTITFKLESITYTFASVSLVFFIIYVIIGNKKITTFISSIFAIFSILYLSYFHSRSIQGFIKTDYGSVININSEIAIYTYIIALFIITTSMILGLLLLLFLQRLPRETHYRKTLPMIGMSIVFDFMLLDFLTLPGNMQLSARIFVVVGIVLTFLSYFSPYIYQKKLRTEDYY